MINDKFLTLKQQGNLGEWFFCLRHNELLSIPVILMTDMADWHVEGSDVTGIRQVWTPSTFINELGENKQALMPSIEYGGIEIKTLGDIQFLPRYGINNLPCGTLGFPLWDKTEDLYNGWTDYTRETHGNLKRWMYPTIENRGARPITIVHLLETCDMDLSIGREKKRYFAAIVFEDVPALLKRLADFLITFGLDLSDWDTIPIGKKARSLKVEGLFLQGNMVHVPLSDLSDLMTVTMIGDDPFIYETGKCSISVQQARLDFLKKLAKGRWIPMEEPANDIHDDEEMFRQWSKMLLLQGWGKFESLERDGRRMSP